MDQAQVKLGMLELLIELGQPYLYKYLSWRSYMMSYRVYMQFTADSDNIANSAQVNWGFGWVK
jgi:hypothetical protein